MPTLPGEQREAILDPVLARGRLLGSGALITSRGPRRRELPLPSPSPSVPREYAENMPSARKAQVAFSFFPCGAGEPIGCLAVNSVQEKQTQYTVLRA